MKITKEQKEAIEYLEKYTKWETYGERNLEKDIITVLELLKDLYNDNIRYEKELHDTLKYSISKEKIKDTIEELSKINIENKESVKRFEEMRRNTTDDFYKKSYQTSIHKLNAQIGTREYIINKLEELI